MKNIETFYNPEGFFGRVILLSLDEANEAPAPQDYGSVQVVNLGLDRPRPHRILLGEPVYGRLDSIARRVLSIARDGNVDLLVQRYGSPLWHGVPIVWAARQMGKPSIITYQSESKIWKAGLMGLARRASDAAVHRYLRTHASRIWAVSESLRETLIAQDVDAEKTVAIPNKDDLDRYATPAAPQNTSALLKRLGLSLPESAPLFLAVGRLIPEKNYFRVIEGFAKALETQPLARCIIVGAGPLESELRSLIRAKGIEQCLSITTEPLTQDELTLLYQRSTALLFCSTSEGQGRVVYEALASGTRVIGADIGPVREMIDREEIGELVDPLSTEGIAAAIVRYLEEGSPSLEVAGACQSAASKFDLTSVNPREAAFYTSTLGNEFGPI